MSETERSARRMQSIQGDLTLPKRPKRPVEVVSEPQSQSDETMPRKQSRDNSKPVSKASDQVNVARSISFTTPVAMREQMRRAAQERETTLAQLVLDAIEAASDELGDLVASEQPAARSASSLFPQRENVGNRKREPRVATSLRIGSRNLQVLDDLVKRHKAENRSELITAALRAYLS